MNYDKFKVDIECAHVTTYGNDKPIFTFRRVVDIEPYPPAPVWQFIRYIATQIVPIVNGKRLITFCHEMRSEIISYFRSVGFDIEPLFYMSVAIRLSSDEYEFLTGLI